MPSWSSAVPVPAVPEAVISGFRDRVIRRRLRVGADVVDVASVADLEDPELFVPEGEDDAPVADP